jgi:hypothetical protein
MSAPLVGDGQRSSGADSRLLDPPSDGGRREASVNVALAISIAVAVISLATLVFREVHLKKEGLDQLVTRTVDAKMGDLFTDIRALEKDVQKSLREQLQGGTKDLEALTESGANTVREIRSQLELLEQRAEQTQHLENLLERADEVVPRLETAQAVIPAQLVMDIANGKSADLPRLLGQLLEHPASSAQHLEHGGDFARERLEDEQLALRLYEASVAKAPRVSAQAELLAIKARSSVTGSADSAFDELLDLWGKNHNNPIVATKILNVLIGRGDYQGLAHFCTSALEGEKLFSTAVRALLTRNYAIALSRLEPDDDAGISQAYDAALEASRQAGGGALVNVVRPYSDHLLRAQRFGELETLILEALKEDPTESQLYSVYAEMKIAVDDLGAAEPFIGLAYKHAESAGEQMMVAQLAAKIHARQELDAVLGGAE